ncbi:MAG: signal recognition particle protein [Deltaproteobacteria bacterium]|nr:signal recognition particle protein [Deltaproteobacteria bacterium]
MLETVSKGFRSAKNFLAGQAELTETNTEEALREVRMSLLEADVEFSVVKGFLARVKEKAVGETVQTSGKDKSGKKHKLNPADRFIGICYEELEALMGPVNTDIMLQKPIGTIMMVGLQGTGKTTTTGKLAMHLQKLKHRPMLVAADIYRPAAVDQLKVLGSRLGVPVYSEEGVSPPDLCKSAIQKAKEHQCDVLIFDTAGRLSIDDELMEELEAIKKNTQPDNIFLVVDSMMGQDAVRTGLEFHQRLDIDGFIMTKLDGDARGGAALSIKEITGKPIKFLGMGEELDALEEFRPQGLASRILGMGDVVGLVKDFEEHIDAEKAEKDAQRMLQGKFTFEDFLDQLRTIKKMGSVKSLMEKIPGMGDMMPEGQQPDDNEFVKLEAMVCSMTKKERLNPSLFDKSKSRKQRVAKGSGRTVKELDELLQKFNMMKQMMQMIGMQPGLMGKMPGMKNMAKMAKMAKGMGGGMPGMGGMPGGMGGMPGGMGGMGDMFGGGGNAPLAPPPGYFTQSKAGAGGNSKADKAKKEKRKAAKSARKKNKKRK